MKKVLFFACALVAGFALTSCDNERLTPTGDTTKLWIAGEDDSDLLGYIDANGKMVIPANYERAYGFSCGWALVREDGETTYIDKNGKSGKVPDADTYYTYFYHNLVSFKEGDLLGKWDTNFKEVIPADYKALGPNTDAGLFWYTEDGTNYGFLNEQGKAVLNADDYEFSYCGSFDDGICVVGIDKKTDDGTERRYGVIDKTGEYTISPQKSGIFNMGEGRVAFFKSSTSKYGIWDKNGEEVISATYDDLDAFSCGLAMVVKNDKYGFIDKNGNEVISPRYHSASGFYDNVAWVMKSSDSRIELIDKNGEQILRLKEEEHPEDMFHNGLCLIYNNDTKEYRYIDKDYNVVYKWEDKSVSAPARKSLREIGLHAIAAMPYAPRFMDRLQGTMLTQEGEVITK